MIEKISDSNKLILDKITSTKMTFTDGREVELGPGSIVIQQKEKEIDDDTLDALSYFNNLIYRFGEIEK